MSKQKESLRAVQELIGKIQTYLNRARILLQQISEGKDPAKNPDGVHSTFDAMIGQLVPQAAPDHDAIQVVEGVFDGYFMLGSDKKKYPVPLNYSSKTKLIPGDVLKLRIMQDGKLIYKLIGQAPRQYLKATLSKSDDNKFTALSDNGEIYYLNQAAVTYFKGTTGDELAIIVNSDGIGDYAAVEALIPRKSQFPDMDNIPGPADDMPDTPLPANNPESKETSAKTSSATAKKTTPAAKKPAAKKSATKKPATTAATKKKTTAATKKPAAKKTATKKPAASKKATPRSKKTSDTENE